MCKIIETLSIINNFLYVITFFNTFTYLLGVQISFEGLTKAF